MKLAAANKAEADRFAEEMRSVIEDIWKAGIITVRGITDELNRQGIKSARGVLWHIPQTHKLLKRFEPTKGKRQPTTTSPKKPSATVNAG